MSSRPTLTPPQRVRANERARRQIQLAGQVDVAIQSVAPDLWRQDRGAGLTPEQLARIEALISGAPDIYQIRDARRILRRMLRDLQKGSGGNVALPDAEITVKRKPSPFAGNAIGNVKQLHILIDHFLASLIAEPLTAPQTEAGRIVFSAVTLGGLLHKQLVDALPKALQSGSRAHGDLFWLELPLESGQSRRWFPDPVTASLILRWTDGQKKWPASRAARQLLNDQIMRMTDAPSNRFPTFEQLRAAAETRLRLLVPALLVDHLASIRTSHSLPERAWWRLIADYHICVDTPEAEEAPDEPDAELSTDDTRSNRPVHTYIDGSDPFTTLRQFMRELLDGRSNLLRSQTIALRKLQQFFDSSQNTSPMLAALMAWAIWLLQPGRANRLRPTSVYRYLSAVASQMLKFAGEVDPDGATAERLESIYESVLQSTRSEQGRRLAVSSLRSFHAHLMFNHGTDPAAIDGQIAGGQVVRANVISNLEYLALRRAIRGSSSYEPLVQRLELMVVLLYRLGLRKNELRFVCLQDLQIDEQGKRPLLWIHGHPQRQLKTSSSTRRLPLQHLLTKTEWDQLMAYHSLRLRECGSGMPHNALLFPHSGTDVEPMPEALMDSLVSMMRAVCNDQSLVLHSLRHSFLCNLFADIMLAGLAITGAEGFQKTVAEVMPWHKNRPSRNPLKTLFVSEELPRSAAYTMAILAGHIGPGETLHTYTHLQDYLAYLYLRHEAAMRPTGLWAAMEGVSASSIHVRHSREKARTGRKVVPCIDTPARLLKKCRFPLPAGKKANRSHGSSHPSVRRRGGVDGLTLHGAYRALSTDTHFMSHNAREMLTGLPTSSFQLLSRNARFLAELHTAAPKEEARRFRLLAKHPPRRRPAIVRQPQLDRIGPAIPKRISERNLAQAVYNRAVSPGQGTNPMNPDELLGLLRCASRSKPWLRITRIDDAVKFMRMLSQLGAPYSQQELVIASLPPASGSAKTHLQQVRRQLGKNKSRVTLAEPGEKMARSNKTNPEGVFHLVVRDGSRRSTGWLVGCYYAAVVLATYYSFDWTLENP